jgi:hypothetical protein
MPGDARPWNPKQWEEQIQRLLRKRYANPTGSYQQIAPETHGDCGLEGSAYDGTGYQCYGAQDWTDSAQLLKKQKNKMTRDIGKKDLLKHAREKEIEVLSNNTRQIQSRSPECTRHQPACG